MQEIAVRGGRPLTGIVQVSGSKNAALPIMAASLMTRGAVLLRRAPRLSDVNLMARILRRLGVTVEWVGPDSLLLVPQDSTTTVAGTSTDDSTAISKSQRSPSSAVGVVTRFIAFDPSLLVGCEMPV